MMASPSSVGKSPQIQWTEDLRLGLHLLHLHVPLSWSERAKVFNEVFKAEISCCGLMSGADAGRLRAQYNERYKESTKHIWDSIINSDDSDHEVERRAKLTERMREAAKSLGTLSSTPTHQDEDVLENIIVASPATPSSELLNSSSAAADPFTPPNTPTAAADTRYRLQLRGLIVQDDSDEDYVPSTPIPSKRKAAGVHTTRVKNASASTAVQKIAYSRQSGDVIMIPPWKAEAAQKAVLTMPKGSAVFPPLSGLLFRYWDGASQSPLNDRSEFVARRFRDLNIDPPPPPHLNDPMFFWGDIELHMNRKNVATPFVSTSNSLSWVVRLALKKAERGVQDGHITLIEPTSIPRRSIFYAKPFHMALKAKLAHSNGAWLYPGTHEYLVYHKIPRTAIISTFAVKELYALAARLPPLAAALQFHVLTGPGALRQGVRSLLGQAKVSWTTPGVTAAIAELVKFFGLGTHSPVEHISHFVADVTLDWAFVVDPAPAHQWLRIATKFATALAQLDTGDDSASIAVLQKVKLGFLQGIRFGVGDFNARHSAESMAKLQRKAVKIGVGYPSEMLIRELEEAKADLFAYEAAQRTTYHPQSTNTNAFERLTIDTNARDQSNDVVMGNSGFLPGQDYSDEIEGDEHDELVFERDS